jgi:hypothetical protein
MSTTGEHHVLNQTNHLLTSYRIHHQHLCISNLLLRYRYWMRSSRSFEVLDSLPTLNQRFIMEYHQIFHDKYSVIRPSTHGISDIEWEHGCRIKHTGLTDFQRRTLLHFNSYEVLDSQQWAIYIDSLTNPGVVPSNNFVSTRVIRDKWDSDRPIY